MSPPPSTLAFLCLATTAFGQNIITTFAGGDWVYPRTSLPAVNAPLGAPASLAFAPNGDLLIADTRNALIIRVTPAGVASVAAGNGIAGYSGDGGPATSASLGNPVGVSADAAGNIYIADSGVPGMKLPFKTAAVRKVAPDGTITTLTVWGRGTGVTQHDGSPPGPMAVDTAGNLYIADGQRVWRFAPNGGGTLIAGSGLGCPMTFCSPGSPPPPVGSVPAASFTFTLVSGITLDPMGNLYVADLWDSTIYKVTPSGSLSTFVSNIGSSQMACDRAGNLYATDDRYSYSIKRISPAGTVTILAGNGTRIESGDGGLASSAGFGYLGAVVVDASGTVYAADTDRVRAFTPGGAIHTFAGNGQFHLSGDGGQARGATFDLPLALATDSAGNLYIAEFAGRIRKVGPDGIVHTIAGTGTIGFRGDGGPAISATIARPTSMAADASGTLYFCDWEQGANAGHIRKITPNGIITSVSTPYPVGPRISLALDPAGNLYVADTNAAAVTRIAPSGIATAFAGTGKSGYNGDNIPATQAMLYIPSAVATDSAGNVYIGDGSRLRKVSTNGVITTIAQAPQLGMAGGTGVFSSFNPYYLAINAAGDIFAASETDVWKILPNRAIIKYAGNGTGMSGASGDGGPATSAQIAVSGIATNARGDLYIANSNFNFGDNVRVILATAPSWSVSPATLSFQAQAGGIATAPQPIHIAGLSGMPFTAVAGPSWLSVSPSRGTVSATIQAQVNPAQLGAGVYQGAVTISIPGANPPTQTIPVVLTIASTPPHLAVLQSALSFTLPMGTGSSQQPLLLANQGGGAIAGAVSTATDDGASWLSVSSMTAAIAAGGSVSLGVSVTAAGLPPASYTGHIALTTDSAGQVTVPVTLTVMSSGGALVPSQTGLTFTAVAGGGVTPPQSFSVLNAGSDPVNWTAAASALSGGPGWLAVTPGMGVSVSQSGSPAPVQVSVDATGLALGSYQGAVTLTPLDPATSQPVSAALNVLPAGSTPPPLVRPSGLVFTSPADAEPGSQQIVISNLTGRAISYTSARIPEGADAWFVQVPSQSTIPAGQSATVTVQPNVLLSPGAAYGALTFLFDDGSLATVNMLVLTQPHDVLSCIPTHLLGVFTSFADGDPAIAGQPFAMSARITDNCGAPFVSGPVSVAFGSADTLLLLNGVGNGNWEATWTPSEPVDGLTAISLSAPVPGGDIAPVAQANIQISVPQTASK
jgi:sugar lactone lactonase YvrE